MMRKSLLYTTAILLSVVAAAHGATFIVDSTIDAVDAVPGDGVCATASAECTLRAAISEANALPGADTINLPAGDFKIGLPGAAGDAGGDFNIRAPVTIVGESARSTALVGDSDENNLTRVLNIAPDAGAVNVSHVTIRNGRTTSPPSPGGGVYVGERSTLTMRYVDIHNCRVAGSGGGVFAAEYATITIENAAIYDNVAEIATGNGGGGIYTSRYTHLTLTNATIDSNSALRGGGLSLSGTADISHATVTRNYSGQAIPGGIYPPFEPVHVRSSIFAANQNRDGWSNCYYLDPVISDGYNVEDKGSCPFNRPDDVHQEPLLAARTDNGGEVGVSLAPLDGSPAINLAADLCPIVDQRGVARTG
ncbi:MAG: right-handed parallel beta-helix repeat-containing protein, partial [Myxococcales bacterium]|nr:right-handed parallel beta-helix repeat-containing protein [Myxococcales bacterium]